MGNKLRFLDILAELFQLTEKHCIVNNWSEMYIIRIAMGECEMDAFRVSMGLVISAGNNSVWEIPHK